MQMRRTMVLACLLGALLITRDASPIQARESRVEAPVPFSLGPKMDPLSLDPKQGERECFIRSYCGIKDSLRWPRNSSTAWTPEQCRAYAEATLAAAEKYNFSPTFLTAFQIVESELNEKATRPTYHGQKLYAIDGGFMGIRCIVRTRGKVQYCNNALIRGKKWADVMSPEKNIEIGAIYLDYLRNDSRSCRHRGHAWWMHYNGGRRYPYNIGVLTYALAQATGWGTPELEKVPVIMTPLKPTREPISVARPMGKRLKRLCKVVADSANQCQPPSLALSD